MLSIARWNFKTGVVPVRQPSKSEPRDIAFLSYPTISGLARPPTCPTNPHLRYRRQLPAAAKRPNRRRQPPRPSANRSRRSGRRQSFFRSSRDGRCVLWSRAWPRPRSLAGAPGRHLRCPARHPARHFLRGISSSIQHSLPLFSSIQPDHAAHHEE